MLFAALIFLSLCMSSCRRVKYSSTPQSSLVAKNYHPQVKFKNDKAEDAAIAKWNAPCFTDYSRHDGWSDLHNCYCPVLKKWQASSIDTLSDKDMVALSHRDAERLSGYKMNNDGRRFYLVRALFSKDFVGEEGVPQRKFQVVCKNGKVAILYKYIGVEHKWIRHPLILSLKFKVDRLYVDPMGGD